MEKEIPEQGNDKIKKKFTQEQVEKDVTDCNVF